MTGHGRFFAALRMTGHGRFFAALRMTGHGRFFAALRMTGHGRFFAALRMTRFWNCELQKPYPCRWGPLWSPRTYFHARFFQRFSLILVDFTFTRISGIYIHTISTTFPVVRRSAMARCACAASARGKVCPTMICRLPVARYCISSRVAAAMRSGRLIQAVSQ